MLSTETRHSDEATDWPLGLFLVVHEASIRKYLIIGFARRGIDWPCAGRRFTISDENVTSHRTHARPTPLASVRAMARHARRYARQKSPAATAPPSKSD